MSDPPPAPLPADLADAAALAEWLGAERDRCVESARAEPRAGLAAARALAAAVDVLAGAAAGCAGLAAGGQALVAMGEWGWGALAPESPVELCLLGAPGTGAAAAPVLERTLGVLRGAGLEAGGEARGLDELESRAESDALRAGELLGARLVAGGAEPFAGLRAAVGRRLASRGRAVIDAAVNQVLERHAGQGGLVCRTEPDLVQNPGGLADHRAVGLLVAALAAAGAGGGLLEAEDFQELDAAGSFLWGCRAVLHGLAGRRDERLLREHQARLAAALGYRSGDAIDAAGLLMGEVLRAMRSVHRAARAAVAQQEEERSWGARRKAVERRRPLGGDYVRIGKRIYLSRPDLFEGRGAGLRMLEGFGRAAAARLGFSQEFLKRVRDNLYMVGEEVRESADAAALFREILACRGAAAETLRPMHESGFLGAYLPEFGEVDCLVTGEAGQEYTVDEHTLMVVAGLDRIEMAALPGAERAAELAAGLPVGLLRLAALVHALGKSRGAQGFAPRSAEMVPRIAGQLRLGEAEARLLVFLTEQQMLLEDVAASRMTSDERLLAELVETIGEAERLDALYVLSVADLGTLGAAGGRALRFEQLTALHARLASRLAARPERTRRGLAEEIAGLLPPGTARAEVERHLAQVPERYLLEVSPEDAALHLRLLAGLGGAQAVAVDWSRRKAHVHFWVLGPDRPRRISQIAGAVLCAGASIISARAYTRADGVIIDQFDLVPAPRSREGGEPPEGSDAFWQGAAETIREVLSAEERLGGRSRLTVLLEGALAESSAGASPGPGPEARVSFDNRVSADYTVVDVQCPDRVGLLYALSAGLSDAGADIAFAKINTVDGVAQDVFYVTVGGAKAEDRETQRRIRAAIAAGLRRLGG